MQVVASEGPRAATEITSRLARGFDLVVAAGGDGTVREVATGLVRGGHRAALGILPMGTGNDVAQLAGVPTDDAFLEAVRRFQIAAWDGIQVESTGGASLVEPEVGVLFAAVGFAGELLRHTTPRVVRWFGSRYCYSIGFFRALLTYRPAQVRVTGEGRLISGPLLLACAANAPHAGGGVMKLAPGARMNDGRLNLTVIRQVSPLSALRQFPALLRGTHIRDPRVDYFEGVALDIESDRPVPVAIDGDLVGVTPARFSVLPGRISVLRGSASATGDRLRNES